VGPEPGAASALTATTPLVTLTGTAADANGIARVTWTNDRGGAGTTKGTTAWTADGIPLKAGLNTITITATDRDDQTGAVASTASAQLLVTVDAFTYYLAEGATGPFFDFDLLLA